MRMTTVKTRSIPALLLSVLCLCAGVLLALRTDARVVVVPTGGKLYLTRGAVFSYYEFTSNKRITDEEWQAMLKEGRQPALPDWTGSFTDIGGPLPEPDLNYIWGE
ncbi:MAG: DUF3160 domain-containing protein [Clostridiaceae bacterium]|jgi:hypothetical protein|nr:DUF3160 domain-containing protein [Clostridiaceae bacterium]